MGKLIERANNSPYNTPDQPYQKIEDAIVGMAREIVHYLDSNWNSVFQEIEELVDIDLKTLDKQKSHDCLLIEILIGVLLETPVYNVDVKSFLPEKQEKCLDYIYEVFISNLNVLEKIGPLKIIFNFLDADKESFAIKCYKNYKKSQEQSGGFSEFIKSFMFFLFDFHINPDSDLFDVLSKHNSFYKILFEDFYGKIEAHEIRDIQEKIFHSVSQAFDDPEGEKLELLMPFTGVKNIHQLLEIPVIKEKISNILWEKIVLKKPMAGLSLSILIERFNLNFDEYFLLSGLESKIKQHYAVELRNVLNKAGSVECGRQLYEILSNEWLSNKEIFNILESNYNALGLIFTTSEPEAVDDLSSWFAVNCLNELIPKKYRDVEISKEVTQKPGWIYEFARHAHSRRKGADFCPSVSITQTSIIEDAVEKHNEKFSESIQRNKKMMLFTFAKARTTSTCLFDASLMTIILDMAGSSKLSEIGAVSLNG
jgi:hypothetical protein